VERHGHEARVEGRLGLFAVPQEEEGQRPEDVAVGPAWRQPLGESRRLTGVVPDPPPPHLPKHPSYDVWKAQTPLTVPAPRLCLRKGG